MPCCDSWAFSYFPKIVVQTMPKDMSEYEGGTASTLVVSFVKREGQTLSHAQS